MSCNMLVYKQYCLLVTIVTCFPEGNLFLKQISSSPDGHSDTCVSDDPQS